MDAINQGKSDNFTVSLEFAEIGTTMPRVREITAPIEHWLDGLDPDHEHDTLPQTVATVRDRALELTAYPTAPQHRGQPTRLLAGGPVTVGSIDTVDELRATLDRKSRKYGEQSEPFVIAVLMPSTFANLNAVEKALFGDTGVKYVRRFAERVFHHTTLLEDLPRLEREQFLIFAPQQTFALMRVILAHADPRPRDVRGDQCLKGASA